MKRKLAVIWTVTALALSGCSGQGVFPYAREMGDMALLRTMGLDGTSVRVELTVSTGSRASGVGAERQDALVLSADGPSIGAAAQRIRGLGNTFVYYGYVDQFLVGEERAGLGMDTVLDYLGRDGAFGLGVQLWVVRDGTAREAIQTAGTQGVSGRLEQLQADGETGAAGISRTAGELMAALARGGSTYLPALALQQAREGDGAEGGEATLHPDGYAILKQGRLVGFARGTAALGLELLEGRVAGRVETLTTAAGISVTLDIRSARISCEPVFRGEDLTGLNIRCQVTGRILQTDSRLTQEDMQSLERALEQLEGERAAQVLELAQYWDADFLSLKRRAGASAPSRWVQIEEQWTQVWRELELTVEVQGTVERTLGMMQ